MDFNQMAAPGKGEETAIMKTSMGDIHIRLFGQDSPKAVDNFTTHARNGYYDGLIFHRVIDEFMIQGGDPTGTGMGGESIWGSSFEDQFSKRLFHFKGALSMANSGPNTNGSQFFIVQAGPLKTNPNASAWLDREGYEDPARTGYLETGGTPWLDHGHTQQGNGHMIFGQVFKGMDVVDSIAAVSVNPNSSKPLEDVVINTIEITGYAG